jgi:hypothetical protein
LSGSVYMVGYWVVRAICILREPHAPACLSPVPIGWAIEPVWTKRCRENTSAPHGSRNPAVQPGGQCQIFLQHLQCSLFASDGMWWSTK